MNETLENFLAVCALSILILIYSYLLFKTITNPSISFHQRNFAIPRLYKEKWSFFHFFHFSSSSVCSDTHHDFVKLLEEYSTSNSYLNSSFKYNYSINGQDDFFLSENDLLSQQVKYSHYNETVTPSDRFICTSGWVTFKSEACMYFQIQITS